MRTFPEGSFNDQQKYSFCEQRIREGYKGTNELDKMCKLHDQFYNENMDTKERNISDLASARRADEIANNINHDEAQRKDVKFISGIMKTKACLGFGLNDKNSSKKREKASWSEELADELYKPVKRKFQRRQVLVDEIDDVWAADLVELQEWKHVNNGYRYILNVIDCFSKYAWSVPLKDKKGETVLDAFKYIVETSNRKPMYIWVDEGKDFYDKGMTVWLKDKNILRYSTHGEHKSAIAKRFNRTLKERMWRRFTAENTRNWIDMLNDLLSKYLHEKLQCVLRAAARLVLQLPHRASVSDIMRRQLHWLEMPDRIRFKLCTLVFRCLHGLASRYLSDLCTPATVHTHLRSSVTLERSLLVPRTKTKTIGPRGFYFASSAAWNVLPVHLRDPDLSLNNFKIKLKTHFFFLKSPTWGSCFLCSSRAPT